MQLWEVNCGKQCPLIGACRVNGLLVPHSPFWRHPLILASQHQLALRGLMVNTLPMGSGFYALHKFWLDIYILHACFIGQQMKRNLKTSILILGVGNGRNFLFNTCTMKTLSISRSQNLGMERVNLNFEISWVNCKGLQKGAWSCDQNALEKLEIV